MSPIDDTLTAIAGEPIRLRSHPSAGVHRYIPVGDPAKSPNADLWRARDAGGWFPTSDEAAVALAFDLGLRQGRQEAAPEVRVFGKIEQVIVASVGTPTAAGTPATEAAIIDATVGRLPLAEGQRDRRREAVRRAFAGLVTHHVLVAAGEDAATRVWQVASRSAT